jgi:hypothetical protein
MSDVLINNTDINKQELGIIRNVGYGMRDFRDAVGLWFTVKCLGTSSLQCLFGDDIKKFLKSGAGDVYDIKDLEGRPIVMLSDGGYSRIVKLDG